MTTVRVASDLASVMVPIGWAGAVFAAICAVVAAVAVVRGAGGLSGGAVGLWMVGTLMSVTASFANQWMPLIAACVALVAMLVIGGVVRAVVSAGALGRRDRASAQAVAKVTGSKVTGSKVAGSKVAGLAKPALPATTASVAVIH